MIGIPRSLFYHHLYPFWSSFFAELGVAHQLSPPTNQAILTRGAALAVDELCLPVKLHLGHLAYLQDKADYLFSPGFGRWGRRRHFCPKLMGLPDLARHIFPNAREFWHDLDADDKPRTAAWEEALAGIAPGITKKEIARAGRIAWRQQLRFTALCRQGFTPPEAIAHLTAGAPLVRPEGNPRLAIAVLGHPYLVYDEHANQQLLRTLRAAGARIHTEEMLPADEHYATWPHQSKEVYWPLGQQILAAGFHYARRRSVGGLIFLTACLCGPDALLGELLERYLAKTPGAPPLLRLTIDEHTGRAGLLTRIEAFIDLLAWRRKHAAL
ncbi:MAG: acyl-CoA dehydratase activase-related protein [Bacteroidota bacterium]